jgi:hypothetical protein
MSLMDLDRRIEAIWLKLSLVLRGLHRFQVNKTPVALGMKQTRVFLLSAISLLLIVGSLYCIVFDTQYWPFSQYPMFSHIARTDSVSELQLYGVTQGEPQDEMPISQRHIKPFNQSRYRAALRKMESKRNPKERSRLLNKALRDSLKRYETLRLAGSHDGPPLQGVRLYRVEWQLDSQGRKADLPDHRKLIAEAEQSL